MAQAGKATSDTMVQAGNASVAVSKDTENSWANTASAILKTVGIFGASVTAITGAAQIAIRALANAGADAATKLKETADKVNLSPVDLQRLRANVTDTD